VTLWDLGARSKSRQCHHPPSPRKVCTTTLLPRIYWPNDTIASVPRYSMCAKCSSKRSMSVLALVECPSSCTSLLLRGSVNYIYIVRPASYKRDGTGQPTSQLAYQPPTRSAHVRAASISAEQMPGGVSEVDVLCFVRRNKTADWRIRLLPTSTSPTSWDGRR
jgi:hypothetical protein